MSLMKINKSSISTKTWQRSEFFFKVLRALKIEPPVLIRFFHVFASSPPLTWVGHHFINIIYNKHSPVSIYGRLSERSLFYYYRNITDSDFVVFFVFFWSKQTMGHVLVSSRYIVFHFYYYWANEMTLSFKAAYTKSHIFFKYLGILR